MKSLKTHTQNKRTVFLIISFFCVLIFFLYSEKVSEAIISALNTSLNVIVPSLFPMLILTYFILGLGFSEKTKRFAEKISSPLFGLSGNSSEAMITGLFGGYNTALKSAERMFINGDITKEEAQRLTLFFTCPGLSFCVNICGLSVYSNLKTGVILLISNILSSFLCATAYNFIKRNNKTGNICTHKTEISHVFIESVSSSVSSMIGIVSWITVFSVIIAIINTLIPVDCVNTAVKLLGEVSSAVSFSAKHYSFGVTAFCLSFGGFCIFFQQLPDIIKIGLSSFSYLGARFIQAFACYLISTALFIIFPVTVSVSNSHPQFLVSSNSVPGSLALLLLGIILINSIKSQDMKKNSTI